MRNHVVGIVGGWEEVLTPLEFTLECERRLDRIVKEAERRVAIDEAVSAYWELCANKSKVLLINATDRNETGKLRVHGGLGNLLKAVQDFEIDQSFLERAYQDVGKLRAAQGA
jgi:hypothetical protein